MILNINDRSSRRKPLVLPSKWMPLDTNHVPQTPGRLRSPPAPLAPAHPSPDSGWDLALPRHHNNDSSECDEDAPDPVLFELRGLRSSTDATAGSRWHDGGLLCLQQCLCGFCVSKNTHINTRTQVFFFFTKTRRWSYDRQNSLQLSVVFMLWQVSVWG